MSEEKKYLASDILKAIEAVEKESEERGACRDVRLYTKIFVDTLGFERPAAENEVVSVVARSGDVIRNWHVGGLIGTMAYQHDMKQNSFEEIGTSKDVWRVGLNHIKGTDHEDVSHDSIDHYEVLVDGTWYRIHALEYLPGTTENARKNADHRKAQISLGTPEYRAGRSRAGIWGEDDE